jgi:hypothetical protein
MNCKSNSDTMKLKSGSRYVSEAQNETGRSVRDCILQFSSLFIRYKLGHIGLWGFAKICGIVLLRTCVLCCVVLCCLRAKYCSRFSCMDKTSCGTS